MRKLKVNFIFLFIVLSITLIGCSSQVSEVDNEELKEFTLEEIAEYDGKDGKPAYVVVDGIVYDVTDSPNWKNGEHNGYQAGRDLTNEIKNESPHGISKLENVKKIGKIVE